MNYYDKKGMVFKNIKQCEEFQTNIWRIGVISIIAGIVLATLSSFNIISMDILNAIVVLTFILSVFLFFYSNFEYNLLDSHIRSKIALEKGKCLRSKCVSNFSKCIDIYEAGYWICIYYKFEFKDELDKLLEKIKDRENELNENKNSV